MPKAADRLYRDAGEVNMHDLAIADMECFQLVFVYSCFVKVENILSTLG